MKCDYHMHSVFSHDSSTPMESQAAQSVKLGMDEICFTDHVDYCEDYESYSGYFAEIERVRQEFSGKLVIRAGWEFGMERQSIPEFQGLFSRYRDKLDFVLLSIHYIDDLELWAHEYQRGKSQAEYTLGYYGELLNLVQKYHDYSVLAHLDLISRYDMNQGISPYPFEKVRDIAAEIMETAIREGKGIELNTSSWRYGLTETTPSREILKLYRDLGGEILTLGSDAHNPGYVGAHFDEGREILRGLGYTKFCTFEKMKPSFHVL